MNAPETIQNTAELMKKSAFCCGCGVCSGICPAQTLKMEMNSYKEWMPENAGACTGCGLCLKVCPFYGEKKEDEKNTKPCHYDEIVGFYDRCFSGFVCCQNDRRASASGGIASFLLAALLEQKEIDGVFCPTQSYGGRLFEYRLLKSAYEIKAARGSVYSPCELSGVIEYILQNEGRYAVTALPCAAAALRLAMTRIPKLKSRIGYIIGLACGQGKSGQFADYIAGMAAVNGVSQIKFRFKDGLMKNASDYCCLVTDSHSKSKIIRNEAMAQHWLMRDFTPAACRVCDDIFAESADICLMDAWLPEFIKDSRGTNLIVSRNSRLTSLLLNSREKGKIDLGDISVEKIKISQQGVIQYKRAPLKLKTGKWDIRFLPQRRAAPFSNCELLSFIPLRIRIVSRFTGMRKKAFKKYKHLHSFVCRFSDVLIKLLLRYESLFNRLFR